MALVAVFLPQLDSNTSLHIGHNSIIGNEVLIGAFGILIALAAIQASYRLRAEPTRYWPLVFLGLFLVAVAIYAGTGERLTLHGMGLFEGQEIKGSPGVGIYALGVGGALIALAGLSSNQSAGA